MAKRKVGYWIAVGLFSAVYAFSATMDTFRVGPAPATLAHLGYPAYMLTILGVWKWGAVVALLAPGLPRLKEWAYAGIMFDLSGGFVSHLVARDPLPMPVVPVVLLGVALTSYLLRPASRRLASAEAPERPATTSIRAAA